MLKSDYENLYNAFYSKDVVITGAGVSTLSGLPDFRGKDGLYNKNFDAETILSKKYFDSNRDAFYQFYKNNMIFVNFEPNLIHYFLASLEKEGFVKCIITQNIDNLHQKAGSKNVVDIHGDGDKFYCVGCNSNYDTMFYLNNGYVCPKCGSVIRPDIVLYGENLEDYKRWKCQEVIDSAEVLIVLGSCLGVGTVVTLVQSYVRRKLKKNLLKGSFYIVNQGKTYFDDNAIKYDEDLGDVVQKILKLKK